MSIINYNYRSVPTVRAFVNDKEHRHKLIMGPVGSGKSSGCVMALLQYAIAQSPNEKGIRPTRYAIVRNSVKELKDTTKKTIDEWIMPLKPRWRESEDTYTLEFKLEDGTIVHSEWMLRSLDRPEQVRDLLSLEVSGMWFNEAREIPKEIFDVADTRIGRYPRKSGSFGCDYPFIIMDTNPPDTDSWLYKYFEVEQPEIAVIYRQPSGLSEEAENIENLPANYYQNLVVGKDPDFVRVYIHGEYGYVKEGKPVFPNFSPSIHIAKEELKIVKSIPVIAGMDFGLFPACVFTQQFPDGRIHIIKEIYSEDAIDVEEFTKTQIIPVLRSKEYIGVSFYVIGDPAGNIRSQLDSRTCFQVLRSYGIKAYPAYTNALQPRIQAVNQYLTRMIKGEASFKINKSCAFLIKALSGKYCFRRIRVSAERYTDVPDKNIYSHISDALMYACLGYTPSQKFSPTYTDIDDFSSSPLTPQGTQRVPLLKI